MFGLRLRKCKRRLIGDLILIIRQEENNLSQVKNTGSDHTGRTNSLPNTTANCPHFKVRMRFSDSTIIAILATGILSASVQKTRSDSLDTVDHYSANEDPETQVSGVLESSLLLCGRKEDGNGTCVAMKNDGTCSKRTLKSLADPVAECVTESSM